MADWSLVFTPDRLGACAEWVTDFHAIERPAGAVLELRVRLPDSVDLDDFDHDRLIPVHARLATLVRESGTGLRLWLRFFAAPDWRAYVESGAQDWPEV